MANEVQFRGGGAATTSYFTIYNSTSGFIWSTSGGTGGYEAFTSGNWSSYVISATELGVSNVFQGSIPAAVPAGVLGIDARRQVAGSPAMTDQGVAAGNLEWNGSKTLPLADLTTSGQLAYFLPTRLTRGQAISGFSFKLVSSADHITNFVSGVVSGQISRNGGSFGVLQSGNVSEIGLGWYKVNLTSGDLNADTVALLFTGAGISGGLSDQRDLSIVLQRVSG